MWSALLTVGLTLSLASAEMVEKEETVKLGGKASLDCQSADKAINWKFNVNKTADPELEISEEEGKYELAGSKLTILNLEHDNLGFYTCFDEDDEAIARFEVDTTLKLKKLPKSISIDQGSSTNDDLKCSVAGSGSYDVVFTWYSRGEEESADKNTVICIKSENSDCNVPQAEAIFDSKEGKPAKPLKERATIEEDVKDGTPFSILKISDAAIEDRKIYTCRAVIVEAAANDIKNCTASKECTEVETLLRVKDPLAALWPFAGIVIEVILLCVIIFFCEKRKTVEEKEEYEERSNGNNISSNSSLRQRK